MSKDGNTRKRLIDAAYQVLAANGYEATSIKDIARKAGLSPGLVHYYFTSKEDLLAAVVREATEEYYARMERLRQSVNGDELANAALAESKERVRTHPDWYRLRYELFVLGLRHTTIQEGVKELLLRGKEGIEEAIQAIAGQSVPNAAAISAILLACFDGLALQSLIDPEFDLDGAYRVLSQMGMGYLKSQLEPRGEE
ncbi:TetR/AcrR family transcriptional regulator [Alicyclobacillus macrosporangiidus]|uniref:TetR/AcrR family transcriptional regulator n=1 Tax=Alicyclobacillus macrosporangiidus TaxID=392015 RepID=UPI000554FE26|nr:TetR/AcrR family transcriptional regulator [Alicyclobacillus macrosporangiidus]